MANRAQHGWWRSAAPSHPTTVFLLLWLLGSLLLAFVLIPLLVLAGTPSLSGLIDAARMPDVRDSILLSLEAACLSAILTALFGVPLAYVLARTRFVGRGIISAIVDLPLAVPHTVAGIALLMVFGRQGILGEPLQALAGLKFWGTLAGVVVAAASIVVLGTLGLRKRGLGRAIPSPALAADGSLSLIGCGTALCTVVGLVLSKSLGWAWPDPVAAIAVAAAAIGLAAANVRSIANG